MNRTYIIALLASITLGTSLYTFDDKFYKDIDKSFHRMNKRMSSSFFDKDELNKTLESMQKHMDTMREQFAHIQEDILQQHESKKNASDHHVYTLDDEKDMLKITVNIGDVDTNTIDNHVEQNNLIITIPSNKPSLKIVITPETLIISGKTVEEKEQETDSNSSHFVAARTMHVQQTLPTMVMPTENVSITHNADEKTLTIEVPKKVHKQFSIKKK